MPVSMIAQPDDDDLNNMVKRLTTRGQRLTVRRARALSTGAWPADDAPWWYWLDYTRANKN